MGVKTSQTSLLCRHQQTKNINMYYVIRQNKSLASIGKSPDIYTPYAGAAGMSVCINGKFTMGKLESPFHKVSFFTGIIVNI